MTSNGPILFWKYHICSSSGKEDYQELKDCLGQTFEEIEKLKMDGIEIDGQHFDDEWYVQFTSVNKNKFISQWLMKIVWIPFRVAHLKRVTAVDSHIKYCWKQRKINLTGCYYNYRFCCSDWKFLALVYGLNGASSKYFCIWCYYSKNEINNLDSKCCDYFCK